MHSPLLIHGPIVTPRTPHSATYLPNALIYIDHGIIKWIEEEVVGDSHMEDILGRQALQELNIFKLRKGEFLMPGFIDTHTVRIHV